MNDVRMMNNYGYSLRDCCNKTILVSQFYNSLKDTYKINKKKFVKKKGISKIVFT